MSLEPGGLAEKIGNRYESTWVTYQLLRLLEEKISYVQVEPLGDDEDGVDLIIGNLDGSKEHHQCKIGNVSDNSWSISTLQSKELLTKGFKHILAGSKSYKVISKIGFRLLEDICESARNSTSSSLEFYKYQIQNISEERRKLFDTICDKLELNPSELIDLDKIFHFFNGFEIKQFNEDDIDHALFSSIAEKLVYQAPIQLIHFLQTYPVKCNRLRTHITTHILKTDLEIYQFSFKTYPGDPSISSVISTLNEEFSNSIEPYLILNQNINRTEFSSTLEIVSNSPITLIKADSGVGKSAFLLDLKKHFVREGVIVLPIRLDRRLPEKHLSHFGQDLGFPYSPISCLEKYSNGQEVIVILDQLDALRWTSLHSSNALDICIQMVKEILLFRYHSSTNIKVIMAIRNFELEDDIRFKNWISELGDDVKIIELKNFNADQIKRYINDFEDYEQLNDDQKSILTIPLWLGIYIDLSVNLGHAPKFTSKLELIKIFIENRFKQINDHYNISLNDSENLFNKIIHLMNRSNKATISTNLLPNGSAEIIKSMISVGLISQQNREISFRHQAIYDYELGKKLYILGLESAEEFLKELGSKSQQTLLKREHLRYALTMLYETDVRAFCRCIDAVLYHSNIRFHLKSLVFSTLHLIENLTTPLKRVIDKIVIDTDLSPIFLRLSSRGSPSLIQYLSEQRYINRWLTMGGEFETQALELLRSIVEKTPSLLITELSNFVNQSPEWNQKIYNCLCWNISDDSEELFNLRIELIKAGAHDNHIFWDDLVNKHPLRALCLLELICDEQLLSSLNSRNKWQSYDTENIEEIAKIHPTKVLNFFIPFLDHHFSLIQDDNFTDFKWSHEYGERSELEEYIYKCLFQLVIKASKNMSTGQTDLSQLLGRYKNNPNLIFNRIYANVLLGLDVSHADEAIDWILNNPAQKFQLGNNLEEPVWVLPGKIIDKFSPYCTQEKFERLETTIYYFPSGYNLEQVKSYLDRRRQNHYFPYWGRTQYHLLPRLDNSRIQNKSRQLIVVLDRIFDKYTERDFCNKINGIAGFVSSPIKNIHRLSNKAWKKLLTTDSSSFEEKRLRNDCTESSIKQFSSAFESAVTADPQRFASFALTLPVDIHEDYINALYRGLDNETNRTQSKLTEACKPCPIELVEQVINHFGPSKFSRALQHLLSSNITDISSMHVELLENIAKYSDDPQPHRLNIYHQRHPEELDDISSKDLYLNTINCTRGSAYIGLARKFWEDQEYSISHKYIIENALNDEHAAVRMATATLLLPMYNYDRDYAFNKFIELCRKDIRNALSYGSHYYFNNAFHSSHIEPFTSLVKVMIESKYNDVRMEGHKQVLARWFFNSLFCSEIQQELKSTNKEALLGYSSVIKDLLSEDIKESDYTQLKPIFEILANSEDEEVQKTIGMLFNNKFWSKRFARDFFEIYIHSKAFNNNIEFILYSLEDTSINIADFSPLLLTMIKSINQLNIQGHINYLEIEVVTKIIQQLYDQAENDADEEVLNYCLDMWDELLASNLASLATVTNKIDCGLLS